MFGIEKMQRRDFMRQSAVLALAPTLPSFLRHSMKRAMPRDNGRILVVVQLSGGNDGVNTIIPYADDGYGANRQRLRIADDRIIKIDDHIGFHPDLEGAASLLDDEQFAVVQGVGYPNPSQSHDVSMAIWQTARFDTNEQTSVGWIGRSIDEAIGLRNPDHASPAKLSRFPDSILMGDENPPIAVRGRRARSIAMAHLDDLRLYETSSLGESDELGRGESAGEGQADASGRNALLEFVQRSQMDAFVTSQQLDDVMRRHREDAAGYPDTTLSNRLRMVSQLIKAGFETPVYYAIQPGYDTHAAQLRSHALLLRELGGALRAFHADLETAGLNDRVVVMCFSEFGRRVDENASRGTDHGTAGPVFLSGQSVNSGVIGTTPSLTDLKDDNLKIEIDFRSIYATLLEEWLEIPSDPVLNGNFPSLPLLSPSS